MPSEGYVTTKDAVRLFFQKIGNGPGVVVIPNAAYMFEDFKYLADDRTLVFYDLRNRGRSESVMEASKLKGGVHNDVDDLETIRRHFDIAKVDVIGHSYLGMVVALYAMKYTDHVNRVVQIGSVQPFAGKQYPVHLTGADQTMADVSAKIAQLQKEGPSGDPNEFGRKMWSLMRLLYVTDPADAGKITWSVGHLPNESLFNVMKHYNENLLPSMQSLNLTAEDLSKLKVPVLTVHGTRDRQAPYGGGREWASTLPDARLVTVENGAHLPWIESPEKVFNSIKTFLDGSWPDAAQRVKSLDATSESGMSQISRQ
ncbi:MAG TPA: alpha/beta hydrolase [Terriglobia bacterium]|nr:alpha/beta hydrolase [Terriglobia bacterium]